MRAENFTVAGVMSLNRQIRRTSSASAKSDRQSGRSVECAVMRAFETGESGLLGLAQSIAVRALADGGFAAKKSRCGMVAGAVKVGGLDTVLHDDFSLASVEFLSSIAESMMTVDVSGANCADGIGSGEIDEFVSDVVAAVGAGKSSSLRMVGVTLILADAGSSDVALWVDSKNQSMMSEGGCRASSAGGKCEAGMTPEHRGALTGFGKVRGALRASKVKPSLSSGQVYGAGESESSMAVPVSQAGGLAKVDTSDFEARLKACAVDIDDSVFAEEMRSAIRLLAYALSSRTNLGSKSGDQWSVH